MKKIFFACSFLLSALCGCNSSSENTNAGVTQNNAASAENVEQPSAVANPSPATLTEEVPLTFQIDGGIDVNEYKEGQTAEITFSGFPQSVDAFKKAQEQLGKTPEGAVLLELMAFEIYCHNRQNGLECLKLANIDLNVDCVDRILKDRYNPAYGDYCNPHLVATYLDGATNMNGFKPNKPFKIKVRTHPVYKFEDVESLKGTVINLQVFSNGYDSGWRGVGVIKQKGSPYYKVESNSSMYTQCKPVSFKSEEEYTDVCKQ